MPAQQLLTTTAAAAGTAAVLVVVAVSWVASSGLNHWYSSQSMLITDCDAAAGVMQACSLPQQALILGHTGSRPGAFTGTGRMQQHDSHRTVDHNPAQPFTCHEGSTTAASAPDHQLVLQCCSRQLLQLQLVCSCNSCAVLASAAVFHLCCSSPPPSTHTSHHTCCCPLAC